MVGGIDDPQGNQMRSLGSLILEDEKRPVEQCPDAQEVDVDGRLVAVRSSIMKLYGHGAVFLEVTAPLVCEVHGIVVPR